MKIRRCRRDVPQAGYAQNFRLWRGQWAKYSMALEKMAADIYALVRGHPSKGFKKPISVQFLGRQCGCISCQPTIESAAWCYESSLKAYEGIGNVPGVGVTAVGGGELPAHVGIRGEFFHDLGKAGAHELRVFQRSLGIRLEGAELPLPTEAEVERGVEYSKGIERKA